jgi:hypothetical protein
MAATVAVCAAQITNSLRLSLVKTSCTRRMNDFERA